MITKVHIKGYRKFEEMVFVPTQGMNIIVGGNEAGKSTLLEAITLAITGRANGIPAADALNPYWFNRSRVDAFFTQNHLVRAKSQAPEFRIDVYLETDNRDLEKFRGVNNMSREDSVGLSIWVHPEPEYVSELAEYFGQEECPEVIPVEYYVVEWLSFAGTPVFRRPKDIGISLIDSRTIRSERGIDYFTKQMLETQLDTKDRNRISVEHRKLRASLGSEVLDEINQRLTDERPPFPGGQVGLQVDQSRSASWENTLIPAIDDVPLSMAGQGNQAVAKTLLAMGKQSDNANIIFIEEPENHLSYTRLRHLIAFIERAAEDRQVFITTHSSYVLNRLGLRQVTLLSDGKTARFDDLSKETTSYFQKLSGFDTLRLILADLIVVVEGPSDEIVFNRFFADRFGAEPLDCGVDVMALNSLSFKRCFELAAVIDRPLIALRDNDGKLPDYWRKRIAEYLKPSSRLLFIGHPELGNTLEPQIESVNASEVMQCVFPQVKETPFAPWMQNHKTYAALAIATSNQQLEPPQYIREALDAVSQFVEANR